MSFFKFSEEDIINTEILAYPRSNVILSGSAASTGSVYLERAFLRTELANRRFQGFSEKLGGFVEKNAPFTASIDIVQAVSSGTNKEYYKSINNLFRYYSTYNSNYAFSSASQTSLRTLTIPEIYYDRQILTGSFSASDISGTTVRSFYDNGLGGIYSGSVTGTLVGNIFYSEGIVAFYSSDLSQSFGSGTVSISFKGTHRIPVKIFRCRAPAGELNCSTNPTFSQIKTDTSASNRNEKEVIMPQNTTYITKVGLYNDDYELVAVASLAHPIRKDEDKDLQIRLRWDW